MTDNSNTDFETALATFAERLQQVIDRTFAQHFPEQMPDQISLHRGNKFIKVVKTTVGRGNSMSVHSFVARKDSTTKGLGTVKAGDILKAASWKAPAKHARGTIFSDDFSGYGVDTYGARYL